MVNINWEQLEAVNLDEIGEEEAGNLYQQLVNVDVEDESDVTKLRLLFVAAQAVMQAKAVQAEVAIEELDLATAKLKDLNTKKGEFAIRSPQASDASGSTSRSDRDVERLRTELQEKERQLAQERRENEKKLSRIEDGERERRDLRREISQLNDEIEDYRRRLETSDEREETKKSDQSVEKIREKNKQINKLLEDIENSESRNVELQSQVINLRDKLQESTLQMDKTTADYVQLKKAIRLSEDAVENLKRENESYLVQINDLTEQHRVRSAADDEIIAAVNQRVDEWKAVLSEKEETILKLQAENNSFRDSFSLFRKDSDKSALGILTNAIESRESQIQTLKTQLEQAARDLDESSTLIEKLKGDKSSGDSVGWQIKQIEVLQKRLTESEIKETELMQRLQEAEVHARERDTELTEALLLVKRFEMGEYGLTEAVHEIKGLKQQLNLRDKQIEELTLTSNHVEFTLEEIRAENEELYSKLGLEPKTRINDPSRSRYESKKEREKALNEVLQQEVDRLEEERIEMKQEIRKLAQIVGHRASAYGLTAEDAKKLQDYAYSLVDKNKVVTDSNLNVVDKTKTMLDEVTQHVKLLKLELDATRKGLAEMKHDPSRTVESATQPSFPFSNEDRELLDLLLTFKANCIDSDTASQLKLLRNLLAFVTNGDFDIGLIGRLQNDIEMRTIEKERLEMQLKAKVVQEARVALLDVAIQTDYDSTVEVLSGVSAVAKVDTILAEYLTEFRETSGSQEKLFEENSNNEVDRLKAEINELKQRNEVLETERNNNNVNLKEHDQLLNSLTSSSDEVKRELAETCRRLTVSRVNEKNLLRKCSALMESELQLQKANKAAQNELLTLRCNLLHRVKYLERFKEVASFKISTLQRALEGSITAAEFATLARQHRELVAKYQALLEKEETILVGSGIGFQLKSDVDYDHLKKQNGFLEAQLQAAVEKLRNFTSLVNGVGVDDTVLQKRVALLELKELNERQRADHAVIMYDEQRLTVDKLKERNVELEEKFSQMTKMNLEQQRLEQELREELTSCVTRQEYDRLSGRATEIEAEHLLSKQEISRLKEMTEVAQAQVATLEASRSNNEFESLTLRQQLLDIQSGSDEKALVGKLYRQLIYLHISEVAGRCKLEKCETRMQKIEAFCLRLEQKCDEKDQTLYHVHNESWIKLGHLKRMIRSLRRKLQEPTGREKLIIGLSEIQDYKMKTKKEYELAYEERFKAEEAVIEFNVKKQDLEDLISVLKDREGTQKILNWHRKMSELRLQEMKCSHELQKLRQCSEYQEDVISKQESQILLLEATITQLQSEHDEEHLVWEARESQLERSLSRMDAGDHGGIMVEAVCVPNASLTKDQQLEQAIQSLKTNSLLQIEQKEELKELRAKLKTDEVQIKELELTLEVNRKVTEELRSEAKRSSDVAALATPQFDADVKQTLKIAQGMIESLKTRLVQKEETVTNYERLLERARFDLTEMARNHRVELERLRFKDQSTVEDALSELKRNLRERMEQVQDSSPFTKQITRMNELEDVASQQDNVISTLTEKLKAAFKEIERWQLKVESTAKEITQEKEKLTEENDVLVKKLEREIDTYREESASKDERLSSMAAELDRQIEENKKAPSVATKLAIEKLKQQLSHKEKQLAALSRALTELKGDLRAMAEENALIKANADSTQYSKTSDTNSQQMKSLQEKLDDALAECSRLKKASYKHGFLDRELTKTKEDYDKQVAVSSRLQKEKQHLQEIVNDLEAKIKRICRIEDKDVLEVETLRGVVRKLEEKLVTFERKAEKPYDDTKDEQSERKARVLESWESNKRWQLAVSKLKTRLETKEKDVARLEEMVLTLKNAVTRLDKEKIALEKKVLSSIDDVYKKSSTDYGHLELSRKYFDLQSEVTALKKQLFVEKDLVIEGLQKKETFLGSKIVELESKITALTSSGSPRKTSVLAEELQSLRRKETSLQEQLLKISEENVELRFELEQTKTELPRFKDRVDYLEKYAELLKSEQISSSRDDGTNSSKKQRIGTSGKNPAELEKTVALMKKVVVKLQAENDELKRRTRGDDKMTKIQEEENARLKSELRELTERFGTAQSRDAFEKGTAKIVAHNERLLQDLQKEVRANESLRLQLNGTKLENSKLKERLNELEVSQMDLASIRGQQWNSRVLTRLYEEKLSSIEQKLKCKTRIVDKLKELFDKLVVLEDTSDQRFRNEPTLRSRIRQIFADESST